MENIPIRKQQASNEVDPNLPVPPAVIEQLKKDAEAAGQHIPQSSTPSAPATEEVPHEVFELPSKGHFYSEGSPLSAGTIKIKYMTAQEEDILSSEKLIKKGVVLDYLLDKLIVTPNVSVEDLLVTDKNALFIYARKLAYGSDFVGKVKCPECGAENELSFDLDQVGFVDFDFSKYTKGSNEFDFTFPISKKSVKFKLLDGADEKAIREELQAIIRFDKSGKSPEITTRLKKMITSVEGNTDKVFIKNFVDNLPSRDSLAFRKHISTHTPSLDLTFNFVCEECGHAEELPLPIDVNFFWPQA
jgi:hypothetical protein